MSPTTILWESFHRERIEHHDHLPEPTCPCDLTSGEGRFLSRFEISKPLTPPSPAYQGEESVCDLSRNKRSTADRQLVTRQRIGRRRFEKSATLCTVLHHLVHLWCIQLSLFFPFSELLSDLFSLKRKSYGFAKSATPKPSDVSPPFELDVFGCQRAIEQYANSISLFSEMSAEKARKIRDRRRRDRNSKRSVKCLSGMPTPPGIRFLERSVGVRTSSSSSGSEDANNSAARGA
jgi:hypothetical protein